MSEATTIIHPRQNHDKRRYGHGGDFTQTTGTDTTSEKVTIPASLIEQEQAEESQNAENVTAVQDVIPHRPLGL